MPDKNIKKSTEDMDLSLNGDKIKLEVRRPTSRPSSKCSAPMRPVSAVPMLILYKNDKDDYECGNLETRRPVSAPFQANSDLNIFNDAKLSSSELLKTLLSEPITSWQCDSNKRQAKTNESKDASARSCNGSNSESDSEQSLGAKIQEVAQNGFASVDSNPSNQFKGALMPGVTGKPPLPRKKDDKTRRQPKDDFKMEFPNFTDDYKDCVHLVKDSCGKYIDEPLTRAIRTAEDNTSDYESRASATDSNCELSNDDDKIVHYQNWMFDEADESRKRENETDIYLKNLRKQNEEIQELIMRSELALEKETKLTVKESVNEPPEKDDFDLKFDEFFRERNDETVCESPSSIAATNQRMKSANKTVKSNNRKKPINSNCSNNDGDKKPIDGKRPKKFVATPMRHYKEFQEKDVPEIESWMSQSDETVEKEAATNAKLDFSQVLDSLEELEKVMNGDEEDDSPEEIPVLDHKNRFPESDDIASILEVLEAQDKKSLQKIESFKELASTELATSKHVLDPIILSNDHTKSDRSKLETVGRIQKSEAREYVSNSNTSPTSTNYNSILSFLDEVERNSCKTLTNAKERVNTVTKMLETTINLNTVPKLEDLLLHGNEELAKEIIDLTLRLKDKSSSIKLLQDELSTLRNQIMKMTRQTDEIVKLKLKSQRDEFESIVKRHQKFIDQLIADKKTLNQQCEGLLNEMKVQEDRHNSNMKAMEHKHKVETQKLKDMQSAGEKLRRERWIDNKTQKIKEMTVKSIEPELQNINSRHQQEMADLRSLHKREIEDLELRAARKTQQQCEQLREQLTAEREKAIAHEREILRQRYDAMVESEEKGYQEQRRRLQQEHANRMMELEQRETSIAAERDRAIKQAQDEFSERLQTAIRRHEGELQLTKERAELEMETWKTDYVKRQNVVLAEKEARIRDHYRKERDREIEGVIERLDAEANETRRQIEESTENRIRRLKEKYENEIRDLEMSEKEAKAKCTEIKAKLLETENLVLNLTNNVRHLEQELTESKEIVKKLSGDRARMKEIVKEEIKEDVDRMVNEMRVLKEEKEKEMEQVYARVRVTVARKDELLAELSSNQAALQEKCTYLENMIEQQRKEYLMK